MNSTRPFGLTLPISALLLLCTASVANAHAVLVSARPASGQIVAGPKIEVTLRFNSRIDAHRSRITLVAEDGSARGLEAYRQPSPDSLAAEIDELSMGAYVLRWQVLATDGHITRGELPFRVR